MTSKTKKLSAIAAHRIEALFDDFCIHIAKRYDASYDDAICDWNCVYATLRYLGRNIHIQLKVRKHSNGHNNLPDDIIIVSDFVTGIGNVHDRNEFVDLCNFIFERGSRHGLAPLQPPYFVVKYLAVEPPTVTFTKEVTIPRTLIPCKKLAQSPNLHFAPR